MFEHHAELDASKLSQVHWNWKTVKTESVHNVGWLLSAGTEFLPKVLIFPYLAPKLKPEFGQPLVVTSSICSNSILYKSASFSHHQQTGSFQSRQQITGEDYTQSAEKWGFISVETA